MRTTREKLAIFRACFAGRTDVYGTYDPKTGRTWQVKRPVTDQVILAHLLGRQPYGAFLLVGDRTCAVVVDYDEEDTEPALAFVRQTNHYGIQAYLERSNRRGWHGWVFTEHPGVTAAKARLVIKLILSDIDQPAIEVFPKHDRLAGGNRYGNFINLPLWGPMVEHGRTVFVDIESGLTPYPDQWSVLRRVQRVTEGQLDELIEMNDLAVPRMVIPRRSSVSSDRTDRTFGLLPCARGMLENGVTANQRVACFRLAVQLRRTGLPEDMAVAVLTTWASKNRPVLGKRIITATEIAEQVACTYRNEYAGFGCETEAVVPYCDVSCPLRRAQQTAQPDIAIDIPR